MWILYGEPWFFPFLWVLGEGRSPNELERKRHPLTCGGRELPWGGPAHLGQRGPWLWVAPSQGGGLGLSPLTAGGAIPPEVPSAPDRTPWVLVCAPLRAGSWARCSGWCPRCEEVPAVKDTEEVTGGQGWCPYCLQARQGRRDEGGLGFSLEGIQSTAFSSNWIKEGQEKMSRVVEWTDFTSGTFLTDRVPSRAFNRCLSNWCCTFPASPNRPLKCSPVVFSSSHRFLFYYFLTIWLLSGQL